MGLLGDLVRLPGEIIGGAADVVDEVIEEILG